VESELVTRRVQTRWERKRPGPEEWWVGTRRPLADDSIGEGKSAPDATEHDGRSGYRYFLTPPQVAEVELKKPPLPAWARVITAGTCIAASFPRGKGEVGMEAYHVRTWQGWPHHLALTTSAAKSPVNSCATSWPDSTIIALVSVYHRGSYVGSYSRFSRRLRVHDHPFYCWAGCCPGGSCCCFLRCSMPLSGARWVDARGCWDA
jgi:hypothetical protein